jgi:hypothetical protein
MKKDMGKIFGYAAIVLAVLIFISFLAGFLAWIWGKLIIGFVIAFILWLIRTFRGKPTGNGFIIWWGLGFTLVLIALDVAALFLMRFGWFIMIALIIGILIWIWTKYGKSKKEF